MNKNEGAFIVFEGGEGAGKTTAILAVTEYLKSKGYDVVHTREPGGCKAAEDTRSLIMKHDWSKQAEVHLFAAARIQHCIELINPSLQAGKIVISDRYTPSNLVYQGIVGGCGIDMVKEANKYATEPDLVIYFDVEPEIGLKRIFSNNEREVTRFDKMDLSIHHELRNGYKSLESTNIFKNFEILDSSRSEEEVKNDLINLVEGYLNK